MAGFEGTGTLLLKIAASGAGESERVRLALAEMRLAGEGADRIVDLAGRRLELTAKRDFTAVLEVAAPAGRYRGLTLRLGPVSGLGDDGSDWVELAPVAVLALREAFALKRGEAVELALVADLGRRGEVAEEVDKAGAATEHWHVVAGAGRAALRAEAGSWQGGRRLLGEVDLAPGVFAPGTEVVIRPGAAAALPALFRGQRALGPVLEVTASAAPRGVVELTLPFEPAAVAAAGLRPEQIVVLELDGPVGGRRRFRELRPHAVDAARRTVRVRARSLSAFFPCSPGLLVERPELGIDAAGDVVAYVEGDRTPVSGRVVDERAVVTLAPAAGASWTSRGWFVFEDVPLQPADTVLTLTARVAGEVEHVCELTVRRAQPAKTVARPNTLSAGTPAFADDGTPFVSAVMRQRGRLDEVAGIDPLRGLLAEIDRNRPTLFWFDTAADRWQGFPLLSERFWGNEFARLAIAEIRRNMQLVVPIQAGYPAEERELRSLADFVAGFPAGNPVLGLAVILGVLARALGADHLSVSSRLPLVPLPGGEVGCALAAATFAGLRAAGRTSVPGHLRRRHVPRRDDRRSAFGLSVLAGRLFYLRASRRGVAATEIVADDVLCAALSLRLHPETGQPAILALCVPAAEPGVLNSAVLRLFQRQADGRWTGEVVSEGQPVVDADFDFGPAGDPRVVAALDNREELNGALVALTRGAAGAWTSAPLTWNLAGFPANTTLGMWPQVAVDDQLRTHCAFSFFTPDAVSWLHARFAGGRWTAVQVGEGRREDLLGTAAAPPPAGFLDDVVGFSRVGFHHWAPALAPGGSGSLWYAWGNGLLHLARVDTETLAVGDRVADLDRTTGFLPRLATRGGPLRSAAPAVAYRDPHGESRRIAFEVELAAGLDLHLFDLATSHQVPRREPPRLAPRRSFHSAFLGGFGRRMPLTCDTFVNYVGLVVGGIFGGPTPGELRRALDDVQASIFLNSPVDLLARPQEQRLEITLHNDRPNEPGALLSLRITRVGERPATLTATDAAGMSGDGVCGITQDGWNAIARDFIDLPVNPDELFPPQGGVTLDEIRVTGIRTSFAPEAPPRLQQGGVRFRMTLPDIRVTGSKNGVGFTAVSTEPSHFDFVAAPFVVDDRVSWHRRSVSGQFGHIDVDADLDVLTWIGAVGALLTGNSLFVLLLLVDPIAGVLATDSTNDALAERDGLPLGGLPQRLMSLLAAHGLRQAFGTDPDFAPLDFDAVHLQGLDLTYFVRRPGRPDPGLQTLFAFLPAGRRELGAVIVGEPSTVRPVLLTNNGHFPVSLDAVAIVGSAEFELVGAAVWPRIVLPGDAVQLDLRLRPAGAPGPRAATLRVDFNGSRQMTLPLTGEALPRPVALLDVAPPQLSFGVVNVGNTSTLGLTLSNPGGAPLAIAELRLEGPDRALFALPGVQPAAVQPGASAAVNVSFTPAAMVAGGHHATLVLVSNAADDPRLDVPLFGTASSSQLLVVPTQIAFNDSPLAAVLPAGLGARRNLTINNVGAAALTLAGASLVVRDPATGQASPHFQLLDTAGQPVAPNNVPLVGGAFLALSVQFRPLTAGLHQGTVEIATTDAAQPVVPVPVTGRGVA